MENRHRPRDQWRTNGSHSGNQDSPTSSSKCKRKMPKKNKTKNFLGRCSKLLHNMLELDDSKQCRTAPDRLKYPDYYNKVLYPMDLGKVRQKLQAGDYSNPDDFGADIRLMLDNWKGYIQDHSLPIYGQVTRLSWWFQSEFRKIADAYKSYKAKRQRLGSTSDNESVNVSGSQDKTITVQVRNESQGGSTEPTREVRLSSTPSGNTQKPGIVLSIRHGACSVLRHPQAQTPNTSGRWTQVQGPNGSVPRVPGPGQRVQNTAMQGQGNRSSGTTSRAQPPGAVNGLVDRGQHIRGSSPADSPQRRLSSSAAPISSQTSTTSAHTARTLTSSASTRGLASATSSRTDPIRQKQLPQTRTQSGPGTSLELRASNIWFGDFHIRSEKPVTLTEQGFTFTLKCERAEETFQVPGKEIVRCLAHLGKLKNTLFVFITPACEQRLKNMIMKLQPGQETKICSMFVIFLQEMPRGILGHLIYFFWTMSRSSLFGQLFSEVDRNGALELLANIKPAILQRLKNTSSPPSSSATARKQGSSESEMPSARNRSKSSERNGGPQSRSNDPSLNNSHSSSISADEGNCIDDNRREQISQSVDSSDSENLTGHLRMNSQSERPLPETLVSNITNRLSTAQRTVTDFSVPTPPHMIPANRLTQRTIASTTIPQHQPSFSNAETISPSVQQPPSNFFRPACSASTMPSTTTGLYSGGYPLTNTRPQSTLDGTYFSSFLSEIPSLQPQQPVFPILPFSSSPSHAELPLDPILFSESTPNEEQLTGRSPALPSCSRSDLAPEASFGTETTTAGPSAQMVVVNEGGADLDLEIIIPSDSDDDLTYIPSKPEDGSVGADSDDLVMVRSHISTRCPITQQVMKQPVKNRHCGHFYDREGVQQLIINRAEKARCPVPGCGNQNPLLMQDMDFDQELLSFITSRTGEKKDET